jgi:hypothetical protein
MKMGLTEKQYKHILSKLSEQSEAEPVKAEPEAGTSSTQAGGTGYPEVGKWESGLNRGPANQIGVTKWADVVGSKLTRSKANQLKEQGMNPSFISMIPMTKWSVENPHQAMQAASLILGFMPNPWLQLASSGVMYADAQLYKAEHDEKTANLMLIFAAMGGLGALMKFPYVKQIGAKGMAKIGEKLSKGIKLLPNENVIVKKIIENKDLIKKELERLAQSKTAQKASQVANKVKNSKPVQKVVQASNTKTGKVVGDLAKTGALYGGIMYGHNKLYDKYEQDKQVKYEDSILNNNFKGRK